jgi:hypothetical protein
VMAGVDLRLTAIGCRAEIWASRGWIRARSFFLFFRNRFSFVLVQSDWYYK